MFSVKKSALVLLLLFLCFPGVMAIQYVSFAEPDTLTHKDLYLMYANGTTIGLYNTTSSLIELPSDGDLMFVIKPMYSTPLDDPGAWLAGLLSWAQTNSYALIFSAFLIGILVKKW
jgi:hypothetical protein